jgi:hypothetical protein
VGNEAVEQEFEVVGLRHPQPKFFQQGLEVLFGTLLAMKADSVMKWDFAS